MIKHNYKNHWILKSKTTIILALLFILHSCTSSTRGDKNPDTKNKDSLSPKDSLLNSTSHPEFKSKIACYYELDDKYSDISDTSEISKWWSNKLENVKQTGIENDIFSSVGGGPNGAEWNSDTDLYFIVLCDIREQNIVNLLKNPVSVTLNEKIVKDIEILTQSYTKGLMVSFMIPKEVWTEALRPVAQEDYIPLYGKKQVDLYNNGETVFAAPLNTGEVFTIGITIQSALGEFNTSEYFHIAYGE